jgi:hypothetical protein
MFSSLFPWELIQAHPNLLTKGAPGPYAFSCYDPYLEKIFLSTIPKSFLEEESWKVLAGPEVTVSWLEDNLATLDFFSNSQSYKVLLSEQMSPKVKEFLLNENIDWGDRYFLLTFQKEDKFFEKLKKKVTTLKVKEPRFWEMGKLLKFLCEQTGVSLSYEVQNYLLEAIPNEPGEFIIALKKLALLGRNPRDLKLVDVKEMLSQERINQFELARLWGEKKNQDFYKLLVELSHDIDGIMLFFRFMQGHIIKMSDTSYMRGKSKPSKYDRQIEATSALWTHADLRDELRFFGECEILAKSRSSKLVQQLRLKKVSCYS